MLSFAGTGSDFSSAGVSFFRAVSASSTAAFSMTGDSTGSVTFSWDLGGASTFLCATADDVPKVSGESVMEKKSALAGCSRDRAAASRSMMT